MHPWNNRTHPFDKDRNTILFFAPEAAVVPHYVALCTLARTMKEMGYRVLLVSCGSVVRRCPVLDMHNVPYHISDIERRELFCNGCNQIHDAVAKHYQLESVSLKDFITPEDRLLVNQEIQAAGSDIVNLRHDGIQFGALGIADFALVTKQAKSTNLDSEQLNVARQYTETCLLAYIGCKKIIQQFDVGRVCAFNIYTFMLGAAKAADALNVPFINVTQVAHRDIDRQRYVILPRLYTSEIWKDLCHDWYRWKDYSISASEVEEIADDLFVRELGLGAQHYSPARAANQTNLFEALNLDPRKKTVVLFTSGFDENYSIGLINQVFGAPPIVDIVPFLDQVDWMERVIEHVSDRSDLQLVIRIHPREGKNKREKFISGAFSELQTLAERHKNSCRFIFPEDPISSYDLAELADLSLIAWSTIGLEIARKGGSVLAAFRHTGNPDSDFIPWGGDTLEEYFAKFDSMIEQPATLERVVKAYRNYSYWNFSNSVHLNDIIPSPDHTAPAEFRMPREAEAIRSVFIEGTSLPTLHFSRLRKNQGEGKTNEEKRQVQKHLRELAHLYLCGSRPSADFKLVVIHFPCGTLSQKMLEFLNQQAPSPGIALLAVSGKEVAFRLEEKSGVRFSPMLSRVAPLCADHTEAIE